MGWLKTLGTIGGSALGGMGGGAIGGAIGGAVDGDTERKQQQARNRNLAEANRYSALTNQSFGMDPVTASWDKGALTGGVQGAMMGNSFANNGWVMGADPSSAAAAAQTGLNINSSTPLGGAVNHAQQAPMSWLDMQRQQQFAPMNQTAIG